MFVIKSVCCGDYFKVCVSVLLGGVFVLECLEKNKVKVLLVCEKVVIVVIGGGVVVLVFVLVVVVVVLVVVLIVFVLCLMWLWEELFVVCLVCGVDICIICVGVEVGVGWIM